MEIKRRPRRAGVALVAAATAPLLVAGVANAEEKTHVDGTDDAWVAIYSDSGPGREELIGYDPAGSPTNGDVTSIQATHGPGRITFVTSYASLVDGSGENYLRLVQRMKFDDGPRINLYVDVTEQDRDGNAYLRNDSADHVRPCDDLQLAVDYDADTVTASFPRRCVGKPEWLRYRNHAYSWSGSTTETGDDDFDYFDNGFNSSHNQGDRPGSYSKRIHAG